AALANLERARIARPTDAAGQAVPIPNLTDSGYYSEKAAQGLEALGLDPYMATERQRHHVAGAVASGTAPTTKEAMATKLRSAVGRAVDGLGKVVGGPGVWPIKGAAGF